MKHVARFETESGREVFTASELLIKGALETDGGVHLLTGCPGEPVTGFFRALAELPNLLHEYAILTRVAGRESLAVAMAHGAQLAMRRAMVVVSGAGLERGAEALATATLAGVGPGGGALVAWGDDEEGRTAGATADTRLLAERLRLPTLEPSCPQEIKDWVRLGFALSRKAQTWVGLRLPMALADAGGTAFCYANSAAQMPEGRPVSFTFERDIEPHLGRSLALPQRRGRLEREVPARLEAAIEAAWKMGINRVLHRPPRGTVEPLGFITVGAAHAALVQALGELGLAGRLPVMKLGMVYPLDAATLAEFAQRCRQIVIIEQGRGFVQKQVHELLAPLVQAGTVYTRIFGKRMAGGEPGVPEGPVHPSMLIERLVPLLREHPTLPGEAIKGRLDKELALIEAAGEADIRPPPRPPTLCPGCPHRDTASILTELRRDLADARYMLRIHQRKPVELICHGDAGCSTLLANGPDRELLHSYAGVGAGGGTEAGLEPFVAVTQLVFMGDATFYHSGVSSIAQAVHEGRDVTFVILANATAAYSGQHPLAADATGGAGGMGGEGAAGIERLIEAMAPAKRSERLQVVRIDPASRRRFRGALEHCLLSGGVKVVIADKECGITAQRRRKAAQRREALELGYVPSQSFINVATDVCDMCMACTTRTGCQGLTVVATDHGPKVQTDLSWCTEDGMCHRLGACPSFERVTVHRAGPAAPPRIDRRPLPPPAPPVHAHHATWRACIAGVGGMGVGVTRAILLTAGHHMGYHVQFVDRRDAAVRTGGAISQVLYSRTKPAGDTHHGVALGGARPDKDPTPHDHDFSSPTIPHGNADLLLGIDILEAARCLDAAMPLRVASKRTAAVLNTAWTPTVEALMGGDDFDTKQLEQAIRTATHPERFCAFDVGELAERLAGSKQYANVMLLGVAFQRGYLPLSASAIEHAIGKVVTEDAARNLRAFSLGRTLAVDPDCLHAAMQREESPRQTLKRKVAAVRWRSARGMIFHHRLTARLAPLARLGFLRRRGWLRWLNPNHQAEQFRQLMLQTLRGAHEYGVDEQLRREVVPRAYDCWVWGGAAYAARYCELLMNVLQRDSEQRGYAVTRELVVQLARVMLIRDEPYVAAVLTDPEKYLRDHRRFRVDPARGDRIGYRHFLRPELTLLGRRFSFDWHARDWQLRIVARCRWLRRLLGGSHRDQYAFREWFCDLLDRLDLSSDAEYARSLAIVRAIDGLSGYRDLRRQRMGQVQRRVRELLDADIEQFQTPSTTARPHPGPGQPIRLPQFHPGRA